MHFQQKLLTGAGASGLTYTATESSFVNLFNYCILAVQQELRQAVVLNLHIS